MRRWSKKKDGFDMINKLDVDGRTALALAVKEEREDLADLILAFGESDPNQGDK